MALTIPTNQKPASTGWHSIQVGDETFDLEFRRPTYEEVCREIESSEGYINQRLETLVVGWRGVDEEIEEDGQKVKRAVPFSWDAFSRMCHQFPGVVYQAAAIAARLYHGLTETAEKN